MIDNKFTRYLLNIKFGVVVFPFLQKVLNIKFQEKRSKYQGALILESKFAEFYVIGNKSIYYKSYCLPEMEHSIYEVLKKVKKKKVTINELKTKIHTNFNAIANMKFFSLVNTDYGNIILVKTGYFNLPEITQSLTLGLIENLIVPLVKTNMLTISPKIFND